MLPITAFFESDEGSDWYEALAVSGGPDAADIVRVLAYDEGENDGSHWIALLELKDGRYGALRVWCDYTGCGCQDGGSFEFGTLDYMLGPLAWTREERERLDATLREGGLLFVATPTRTEVFE